MRPIWILLIAAAAFAASELESPGLGFVWDAASKSLRRLSGLPGSLRIEPGVSLPQETLQAWVSPDSTYVVFALPEGKLERRDLLTNESEQIEAPLPEEVLFSSNGKRFALWWKTDHRFAMWGEASSETTAKSIVVPDAGEALILEQDGLLRTSGGNWLGTFSADAVFAESSGRLVVATTGAFVQFELKEEKWTQTVRNEFEGIPALRQFVIESGDSLLAVGIKGDLVRWHPSTGVSEVMADSGVERLSALKQSGFYLASGESPQLLFSLSPSQKLFLLPAVEVAQ
jgi:hypothetical protein